MNVKIKTAILLIISLIAGILLGLIISPLLQRNFIEKRLDNFRKPDRFIEKMFQIVEPDMQQRKQMEKILVTHHERMLNLHSQIRAEQDSLFEDLKGVLTSRQVKKLERILRKGRHFPGTHRYKRRIPSRDHPPFPPPPQE